MRLQRVRGAESRVEMQADKWTVEGARKSLKNFGESIRQRSICVKGEECVGILLRAPFFGETRWYRRYKFIMACP